MGHYSSTELRQDGAGQIRHKIIWLRIVAGVLLLLFVLLLSGTVSQFFASKGHFTLAKSLMISPAWMETYKPDVKAYIEAGALNQDGGFSAALEAVPGA